jgi:DNA-directed RNA polymerase specialized sigma24 family protein
LVQNVRKVRELTHISAWLYSAARKVTARAAKRQKKREARERSNQPYREPEHESTTPRDWEPLFEEALGRMPAKYRDVLLLCEIQQKSRSEAARLLRPI